MGAQTPNTAVAVQPSTAAYIVDDATAALCTESLNRLGWPANIRTGGIDAAIDDIAKAGCPQILIVDLTGSPDPRTDMQALAEVCEPGTLVTALGTWNDVSLYRDLLQAGVQDYLMKPVTADMLLQSLGVAESLLVEQDLPAAMRTSPATQQQTIITGVRGGLGSSALAANLAYHFARGGRETALVDMDLVFGTAAMQFDLEPGRGLVDALENPARVDGLFLERAVVKPCQNLSILGAEIPPSSLGNITQGAEAQLIDTLKDNFSHLVIDLPRHQMYRYPLLLQNASDFVVLADLSIVSARDTIRLIAHAKSVAPHLTIHMVGAMMGLGSKEVDTKDFENSVELPFAAMLPFDHKTMVAAAQASKAALEVAPQSKISAVIRKLAAQIDADDHSKDNKGWLAKILGK